MTKNKKKGFGLGSLIVIIALVLIVGAYMYYRGDNAVPVSETTVETTYPPTASDIPAGQMEQGDEAVVTEPTGTTTPVKN
ncbi:hypothetical protein IT398_00355 [Candidatus Nomurabacteria bacterium]|nr:hypothetical protein [Candidatus Nomurabacteria bacterium]